MLRTIVKTPNERKRVETTAQGGKRVVVAFETGRPIIAVQERPEIDLHRGIARHRSRRRREPALHRHRH